MDEERLTEKTLTSECLYDGRIVKLYKDEVLLPSGSTGVREHIRHIGAACVVALTPENELLLVRQYRYPFGAVLTEVPAGKLDSPDEDPRSAALRELKEETGADADRLIDLGVFYPTCAYTNERIFMYLATNVRPGVQHLDEDEFLRYRTVGLEAFVEQILAGEVPDGKTQTAVLKAWHYLKKQGNSGEVQA